MQTENIATEGSPLLGKVSASTLTHYSQRTVATVSTSGSYEQLDQLFIPLPEHKSSSPLLRDMKDGDGFTGSVVIFEIPHSSEDETDAEPVDGTLVENVMEQCHEVAEAVLEELHEADEGEMHYLEMGLTRNCSILPGDVVNAAAQQQPPPTPLPTEDLDVEAAVELSKDDDEPSPRPPLSAYFLLLSAVVSLSAIGPLLELQSDVSPTMKIVWRQAATGFLLLPLAAMDVYRTGFPSLTGPQWVTFLFSTISYDVFSTSFVLALGYTSVGNDVILANSLALILLVGKLFVGDPVSMLEGTGAIVAFGGAALCSLDSAGKGENTNGFLGDAIAILSAIGGVGYLIFAKTTRQHMPMFTFMFLTMVVGTAILVVFQILVLGEKVSFDRDPNHGLWGFLVMQPDRLPLEFIMAFVCNCCGTMGYVRAMQYFDNLAISSATLLEPVVAEFMACFFGVGSLPGIQGWIGNFLVAAGTFAVIYRDGSSEGQKGKSLH